MIELLKTIALLCQFFPGGGNKADWVRLEQEKCQVRYLKCVDLKKNGTYGDRLKSCVVEKVSNKQ